MPVFLLTYALSHANQLLAWLAGIPFIRYAPLVEGERILRNRKLIWNGQGPRNFQIYLAGSSQTMSAFNPSQIMDAAALKDTAGIRAQAYNLGNVSSCYSEFLEYLSRHHPRILILEYAPHLMSRDFDAAKKTSGSLQKIFQGYREKISDLESLLSAHARTFLGLDEFLSLRETFVSLFKKIITNEHALKAVYIHFRSASGYGQVLKEDGQVWYRVYLPDKEAARIYRETTGGEFDAFKRGLSKDWNRRQFEDLKQIVLMYSRPGYQLIVIRPPVARELYTLENRLQAPQVREVTDWLRRHSIAYLDLNPNDFYPADMSHLDWYDTPEASRMLGLRLSKLIDKTLLIHHEIF